MTTNGRTSTDNRKNVLCLIHLLIVLFVMNPALLLFVTAQDNETTTSSTIKETTMSPTTSSSQIVDNTTSVAGGSTTSSSGSTSVPSTTITNASTDLYDEIIPVEFKNKFQRARTGKVINNHYILRFNDEEGRIGNVEDAFNAILDQLKNNNTTNDDAANNNNNVTDSRALYNFTKAFNNVECASFQLVVENDDSETTIRRRLLLLLIFLESDLIDFVEEDQQFNITQDQNITVESTQRNPTWGLDRIDQKALPLDNKYYYEYYGENVTAYVIDTGVRDTHEEFQDENGNSRAVCAYSAIASEDCIDSNGHGTHVSGTIGGKTYGVAKKVQLVGIKVLGSDGTGSTSGVIEGVDYVYGQCADNQDKKCVVNMSLGGGESISLDLAVQDLIFVGVFVAVAAGNDDADACTGSPANLLLAVTVASSDQFDTRSSFSNWGTCVEIFAPGSMITSAWHTSDTATNTISGTSMASPFVSGAAALYWSANPNMTSTELATRMRQDATPNIIKDAKGSDNLLLNTEAMFTIPTVMSKSSPLFLLLFTKSLITWTTMGSIILAYFLA